jgi:DMSO/TMAO reductase YedYZ molybdopterin-dependent catalytic subunit
MSESDGNRSNAQEPVDAGAERQIARLSRRSFTTGGIAALAGAAGLGFLYAAPHEDGVSWPLRRMLQFNERVSEALLGTGRPAPTFDRTLAREPRVNGRLGLRTEIDPARWRLDVLGDDHRAAIERPLPLAAIHQLPRHEYVLEFKCVEGWSQIVHWTGARLADFWEKFGHDAPFIGLATPDQQYYVGLDRASAMHPQTLLAYEMNGQPLTPAHGAPLRLVCPLKYGVKSIKRIGSIRFASERPADYWAERGYDWYLGH